MTKEHFDAGRAVVKQLKDAGYTAYFAGGWVRDYLLKIPSDDIDIATTASCVEIQKLFEKTIPVGVAFGVVIVVYQDHQFEMATFRKDRAYIDGRRPIGIDPASPEEDAKRRDFTINGMFYDPLDDKLYDYVDGKADLKAGVVRAIGDPHLRFEEDRLRMMRAVRYSARFHFTIEDATLKAVALHANELLNAVAIERIWQEFEKMARFPRFDHALITMHRLGLLQVIFPNLSNLSLEDLENRLSGFSELSSDTPTIAYLLELVPTANLKEKLALCDRFKVSNKTRSFTEFHHHLTTLFQSSDQKSRLDDYEWAKLYAHPYFDESIKVILSHVKPENRQSLEDDITNHKLRLASSIERLRTDDPILKAAHLQAAGIQPGKTMGILIEQGKRISTNENLDSPDAILERLKTLEDWPKSM